MRNSHTLIPILLLVLAACKPAQETRQDTDQNTVGQNPETEIIPGDKTAAPISEAMTPATDSMGAAPEKVAAPAPAKVTPEYSAITLVGYECGDNCYLVYKDTVGKEERALCRAKICDSWEKAQGMPKALVGKRVKARMGKASQYDAAGNEMSSDFPSVEEIVLP